ncbi:MAG: hypothetical protein H6867_03340 [Rhodospirillales bacterium]|nr:hypothetical protein [Rhodospirillales bacterium]MCB9996186.1 hypothetical protein [Rhodospirillales bacterium]
MPVSDIHKKKLKKNLAILGLIFLWCALIWMVTMIKIARADDGYLQDSRDLHQQKIVSTQGEWLETYHGNEGARSEEQAQSNTQRETQQDKIDQTKQDWEDTYANVADERMKEADALQQARNTHQDERAATPQTWWDAWTAKKQSQK